jgi:Skp family chaperone for outer membrane proteins
MRRLRFGLLGALCLTATLAGAQPPPAAPSAAKVAEPSPGDKCLAEIGQWQSYAAGLKASRDALEQDVATLRAQLTAAQAALAKATPKP